MKTSCGSDPTYESLDPVSKKINWSQHPLQDPIDKGRSVFIFLPPLTLGKVYVQWAIACRCWWHTELFWLFGKSYTRIHGIVSHGGKTILLGLKGKWLIKQELRGSLSNVLVDEASAVEVRVDGDGDLTVT